MDANIEKYRKSEATIYISGKKDLTVNVEQVSHDFLFGMLIDTPRIQLESYTREYLGKRGSSEGKVEVLGKKPDSRGVYAYTIEERKNVIKDYWKDLKQRNILLKRIGDIANLLVINPFYWATYEPQKGKVDPLVHDFAVKLIDSCKRAGSPLEKVVIKGHPLVFGNWHGTPVWLPEDYDEMLNLLERRIKREMTEFKDINIWDVVNEPVNATAFGEIDPRGVEYIKKAFRWAREANPNATLVLNQTGVLRSKNVREAFKRIIEELITENVPFDVIGIQGHIGGTWYDADYVYNILNEFAKYGKPIHITELDIYSKSDQPIQTRDGVTLGMWSKELQAKMLKNVYTICYSHPSVESVNYWGLYDTWKEGTELLNNDFSPKPAYNTLYELVNSTWRTNLKGLKGEVMKAGRYKGTERFTFNGFHGKYKITAIDKEGNKREWMVHLSPYTMNNFSFKWEK